LKLVEVGKLRLTNENNRVLARKELRDENILDDLYKSLSI